MGRSPALPPPPTAPVQLPGGGVRYDNPAVNGILVDHCVSWGTNCGNGGADQFCRLQGQGSALSFQVSNPGRTYVLGDRRVCEGGNCVGFTQVVCAGAGQVAPPPPLIYPPVNPPPPPPGPPPAVAGVTWYTSAKAQVGSPDGQRFSFNCPPVGPDGFLSIWGSDVYTYDSGICLAGAHVGVITRERGGVVTIEMRPGLSSYPASVRNGVSSQGYGAYNKSFAVVSGTGYRIAPPVSSLPVQPPSPLTPPPPPPVIPGSTTTPFFPATAQAAQFLGCFKDPNNPFDLDGYLERSRQNTPQRCVQVCASRGFKYAGVQFAESCLCGNSYGRFGQAANCNMACTGDGRQVCGGSNANSVYSTGQ